MILFIALVFVTVLMAIGVCILLLQQKRTRRFCSAQLYVSNYPVKNVLLKKPPYEHQPVQQCLNKAEYDATFRN